jgi:hypothetical protein
MFAFCNRKIRLAKRICHLQFSFEWFADSWQDGSAAKPLQICTFFHFQCNSISSEAFSHPDDNSFAKMTGKKLKAVCARLAIFISAKYVRVDISSDYLYIFAENCIVIV